MRYLTKRGSRFYYKRRIPQHARQHYGSEQIRIALSTTDPVQAQILASSLSARYDQHFLELKAGQMDINDVLKNLKNARLSKFEERTKRVGDETSTVRRIDPDAVRALSDAGLSSDQIADLVKNFLGQQTSTAPAPVQQAQQQSQNSITLSELIEKYNEYRRVERGEDELRIDASEQVKFRRLIEILGSDADCYVPR